MAKEKPIINVAFVGHVDHGKSTTIGRLMFDSGKISQQDLDKLKAKKLNNSSCSVGNTKFYVGNNFVSYGKTLIGIGFGLYY